MVETEQGHWAILQHAPAQNEGYEDVTKDMLLYLV